MTRQVQVHPYLARQVANAAAEYLGAPTFEQVHPGVFAHPSQRELLVVCGAAPISDPAMIALRRSDMIWEFAVVQYPSEPPRIVGPRHAYDEHGQHAWHNALCKVMAHTCDVVAVASLFDVMYAANPLRLTALAMCSGLVAAAIPFELEQIDAAPFARQLASEIDAEMRASWESILPHPSQDEAA